MGRRKHKPNDGVGDSASLRAARDSGSNDEYQVAMRGLIQQAQNQGSKNSGQTRNGPPPGANVEPTKAEKRKEAQQLAEETRKAEARRAERDQTAQVVHTQSLRAVGNRPKNSKNLGQTVESGNQPPSNSKIPYAAPGF